LVCQPYLVHQPPLSTRVTKPLQSTNPSTVSLPSQSLVRLHSAMDCDEIDSLLGEINARTDDIDSSDLLSEAFCELSIATSDSDVQDIVTISGEKYVEAKNLARPTRKGGAKK